MSADAVSMLRPLFSPDNLQRFRAVLELLFLFPDGREISWVMTLIIVSLLSALIGAVVMITIIKCRK